MFDYFGVLYMSYYINKADEYRFNSQPTKDIHR